MDADQADPNETGPTGVPALLLTQRLVVPPLVGKANQHYTFSFYARSRGVKKQQINVLSSKHYLLYVFI